VTDAPLQDRCETAARVSAVNEHTSHLLLAEYLPLRCIPTSARGVSGSGGENGMMMHGGGDMLTGLSDTIRLANGVAMPRLGLGTYKSAEGGDVEGSVLAALELGYRSIDTASLYGNEAGIGKAIAASGVGRDEIFLASKVWNDEQGYENTLARRRSLDRLRYRLPGPVPGALAARRDIGDLAGHGEALLRGSRARHRRVQPSRAPSGGVASGR